MQKSIIKNEIYENILKRIMTGEFKVGEVYTEKELAEQFGVSKTPVREAMIQLCSEGILENFPRFGYKLVEISPRNVVDAIKFRRILEVEALKLCFNDITPSQIEILKAIDSEYEEIEKLRDTYAIWENNVKFHRVLSEMCPNKYIQNSVKNMLNLCTRFVFQHFSQKWTKNIDTYFHGKIIRAIENKDLDTAVRILSEDVELLIQGNVVL